MPGFSRIIRINQWEKIIQSKLNLCHEKKKFALRGGGLCPVEYLQYLYTG